MFVVAHAILNNYNALLYSWFLFYKNVGIIFLSFYKKSSMFSLLTTTLLCCLLKGEFSNYVEKLNKEIDEVENTTKREKLEKVINRSFKSTFHIFF